MRPTITMDPRGLHVADTGDAPFSVPWSDVRRAYAAPDGALILMLEDGYTLGQLGPAAFEFPGLDPDDAAPLRDAINAALWWFHGSQAETRIQKAATPLHHGRVLGQLPNPGDERAGAVVPVGGPPRSKKLPQDESALSTAGSVQPEAPKVAASPAEGPLLDALRDFAATLPDDNRAPPEGGAPEAPRHNLQGGKVPHRRDSNRRTAATQRAERPSAKKAAPADTTAVRLPVTMRSDRGTQWAHLSRGRRRFRFRVESTDKGGRMLIQEEGDQGGPNPWRRVPKTDHEMLIYLIARLAIGAAIGGI